MHLQRCRSVGETDKFQFQLFVRSEAAKEGNVLKVPTSKAPARILIHIHSHASSLPRTDKLYEFKVRRSRRRRRRRNVQKDLMLFSRVAETTEVGQ